MDVVKPAQTAQQVTENDLKRQWLGRYLASRKEQERLAAQIKEARSRAASVSYCWNPAKSSRTNAHSDHVADSVQQITKLENQLREEQEHGEKIRAEITHALFALPLESFSALLFRYIGGMNDAEIARKINRKPSTVAGYRKEGVKLLVLPESMC